MIMTRAQLRSWQSRRSPSNKGSLSACQSCCTQRTRLPPACPLLYTVYMANICNWGEHHGLGAVCIEVGDARVGFKNIRSPCSGYEVYPSAQKLRAPPCRMPSPSRSTAQTACSTWRYVFVYTCLPTESVESVELTMCTEPVCACVYAYIYIYIYMYTL